MSKLVYLAHYDITNGERETSPAGTTMMNYVVDCLKRADRETVVLSPSMSKKRLPREEVTIGDNIKAILLATERLPKRWQLVSRLLRRMRHKQRLVKELLGQINDGDTLMVYHSLSFMSVVKTVLKKRKIHLILQVCEIYGDVLEKEQVKKRELDFFQLANRYVFQSEQLATLINTNALPYMVLHGTYRTVPDRTETHPLLKTEADTIHCVYAGTLDPRKGGGMAVEAARFLPNQFHIHILGFGTDAEVRQMKDLIADVSSRSQCTVSYDGCLSGEEYLDFLGGCQIGLSTQQPDAAFNATSFPSKILAYMASGLRVVTVRIPAIETSQVGEHLFYYDENTPQSVANTIKAIDLTDGYDGKQIVQKLDNACYNAFCKLIGDRS